MRRVPAVVVDQPAESSGPVTDHRRGEEFGDHAVATQRATKAGWHTSGDLVVPENLSLVFLPPYSPELNPIERLWLHLRDNRLSHCVF